MANSRTHRLYKPATNSLKRRLASRVKQETPDSGARSAERAMAIEPPDSAVPHSALRPPHSPPSAPKHVTVDLTRIRTGMAGAATVPLVEAPATRPRWLRALRWTLAVAVVLLVGYVGWLGVAIWRFEREIYKPIPTATSNAAVLAAGETPTAEAAPADVSRRGTATPDYSSALPGGRTNILVMGTDKRPNDKDHYPRSDTMILVNLDTQAETVRLLTLPRDLVVPIPGYGMNKLNSAYLMGEYYQEPGGGQALAVQTVSELFNVPIDYYVAINFDGFRKVIDQVGGVWIDVPYEIDDYNYPSDDEGDPFGVIRIHFSKGLQHMDGKTALRYARTRHADNDFMRSRRQLQVILATRRAAMSLDILPTLPSLIDDMGGTVETNIPFNRQLALAQFGYSLDSSSIITSTIDRGMITPTIMADGSEGLKLDWKAAKPMLTEFFGRTIKPAVEPTLGPRAVKTSTALAKQLARTPSRTPARAATRTPTTTTPLPRGTRTPSSTAP